MSLSAQELATELEARRISDGNWMARCPSHADGTASLKISEKRDGSPLIHCFGGCGFREVAAELEARGLWSKPDRPAGPPPKKVEWARWVVAIFEDNQRNGRYAGNGQYEPWQPSKQNRYDYGKARAILREVEEVNRAA